MSCRLLLASNSKHRTAFCAALFCKITDAVTRPLRSHFVMSNTITYEVTMWPLTYDGCDDLRSPRESTRDLRRSGGFFFVPRTEWSHSNCISRSVCVAVSFFPDQRNGPSEKFFQRGFLKMKLSICITTWRGKFKLGHLITRKHRSARANYWFNLKIFILWSSGEILQELVWKYLRPFLRIKKYSQFSFIEHALTSVS